MRCRNSSSAFWGRFGRVDSRMVRNVPPTMSAAAVAAATPILARRALAFRRSSAQPKELAIAFRAVGHVVPVRIALQAVVEGAGSQFFQDCIAGTSLPLRIGIIAED
jgi:hypothetical protein